MFDLAKISVTFRSKDGEYSEKLDNMLNALARTAESLAQQIKDAFPDVEYEFVEE